VSKAIVIMTDGWNTQDRWSTTNQNDSSDKADAQAKLDARTRQVCTNIKQAGISIYVVATADAATGLLQSCASNASQYYSITDATQMNAVFQDIAGKLMQLRLAM
jgi:L-lactate utilization protein LutB